jgi:hypothetical protein
VADLAGDLDLLLTTRLLVQSWACAVSTAIQLLPGPGHVDVVFQHARHADAIEPLARTASPRFRCSGQCHRILIPSVRQFKQSRSLCTIFDQPQRSHDAVRTSSGPRPVRRRGRGQALGNVAFDCGLGAHRHRRANGWQRQPDVPSCEYAVTATRVEVNRETQKSHAVSLAQPFQEGAKYSQPTTLPPFSEIASVAGAQPKARLQQHPR